jgi:hypothetical protein
MVHALEIFGNKVKALLWHNTFFLHLAESKFCLVFLLLRT